MRFALRSRLLVAALAGGLLLSACSSGGDAADGDSTPLKIGVLQDKSGIVAASSAKAIEGLTTAVEAINNGEFLWAGSVLGEAKPGILGRKIELVYEDTQANPNQALLAARKLAGQKVAAIIGTTTSPDAIQAKVACEQAKIPCLFPSVSAPAIVAPPNNGYSFTLAPSFDVQAQQVAKAMQAAGARTVTIVQDDSGTANTVAESFIKAFADAGLELVSKEVIPAGSQDATSQVQRVKAKAPGAVMDLVVPVPLNVIFVKQFRQASPDSLLFGINTLVEPGAIEQMGSVLDKAVAIDQFDRSRPEVRDFEERSKKLDPGHQEVGATQLYMATAALILKYAMEKANSTTGTDVRTQLESLKDFPSGFGQTGYSVNWTADNHNGSGPGGVVFVQFTGTTPETWKTFQPAAGG